MLRPAHDPGCWSCLHLGIAMVAPGLDEFGLAMIAANLAFVSGAGFAAWSTGREQPAVRVLFDGACPRCRASMALLDGGRSRPRSRAGRPDRGRCGDGPPGSDPGGLHGVDARGLEVAAGSDGRFRRGALAGGVAAALLATSVYLPGSRWSPGSAGVYIIPGGFTGPGTFPAPMKSVASITPREPAGAEIPDDVDSHHRTRTFVTEESKHP